MPENIPKIYQKYIQIHINIYKICKICAKCLAAAWYVSLYINIYMVYLVCICLYTWIMNRTHFLLLEMCTMPNSPRNDPKLPKIQFHQQEASLPYTTTVWELVNKLCGSAQHAEILTLFSSDLASPVTKTSPGRLLDLKAY